MVRKLFTERIPDILAVAILIIFYTRFINAEYFYGGNVAKISSSILLICSIYVSWNYFENRHWFIKILGGYVGILLLLNLFQIFVVDIISGSIFWFLNLFIFTIYFSLWYYFIVVKLKIRILPNIFKNSINKSDNENLEESIVGNYSLIIGLSVILIFTVSMIIGINFKYNDQIQNYEIWKEYLVVLVFVLFVFSLIGIFLGVKGLRKNKTTSSKIGLVLNSIYSILIFIIIITALLTLY